MAEPWEITETADRLRVSLHDRLERSDVVALCDRLRELVDARSERPELLFVLDELRDLSKDARVEFARLQRNICEHVARTAYVSDRPLFRGVALWISHTSDDFNARSFSNIQQAERWFQSRDERPQMLRDKALASLRLLPGGRS